MESWIKETLDQKLMDSLGDENYSFYKMNLEYHYWAWKYHRNSDAGSLRILRKMLYNSGSVAVLEEPAWVIDRSLDDYRRALGSDFADSLSQIDLKKAFSGRQNIFEPEGYQLVQSSAINTWQACFAFKLHQTNGVTAFECIADFRFADAS